MNENDKSKLSMEPKWMKDVERTYKNLSPYRGLEIGAQPKWMKDVERTYKNLSPYRGLEIGAQPKWMKDVERTYKNLSPYRGLEIGAQPKWMKDVERTYKNLSPYRGLEIGAQPKWMKDVERTYKNLSPYRGLEIGAQPKWMKDVERTYKNLSPYRGLEIGAQPKWMKDVERTYKNLSPYRGLEIGAQPKWMKDVERTYKNLSPYRGLEIGAQPKWMKDVERTYKNLSPYRGLEIGAQPKWMKDVERTYKNLSSYRGIEIGVQPRWLRDISQNLKKISVYQEVVSEAKLEVKNFLEDEKDGFDFSSIEAPLSQFVRFVNSVKNQDNLIEYFLENYNQALDTEINKDSREYDKENKINGKEISEDVRNIISQNFGREDHKNWEQNIFEFFQELLSKHPVVKKMIFDVILPILLSILASYMFVNYLSEVQDTSPRQVIKNVKYEVKYNIEKNDYNQLRIVAKDGLEIKKTKMWSSQTIDALPIGKVVYKNLKTKNWILITYMNDETGEYFSGWTLTRYLSAIN